MLPNRAFMPLIALPLVSVWLLTSLYACDNTVTAAEGVPKLFKRAQPSFEQQWDYKTAGEGFPASIIQMEGVIRLVPNDPNLMVSAAGAYVGYGFGWIEDRIEEADIADDYEEAEHLRRRVRIMYMRAWDLMQHAMRLRADGFEEAFAGGIDSMDAWLDENFTEKEDAELVLWAGQALGAFVQGDLENMDTVAELPMVKVIIKHSVELDPDFLFMSGTTILGVIAAQELPPNLDYAKEMFERVNNRTERKALINQMNMARYYAVNKGDYKLFKELLEEILDAGDVLPEARLSNRIARRRAKRYLDNADQFFPDVPD